MGPWTRTGSRLIYKNSWLKVREDKVIGPNKKPNIFGVVEQIGGVSVVPVDAKGNVYLTKEFHYGVGRNSIEVISGGSDKGESLLDTAKRELMEETGLTAKKWTYLGVIDPLTTILSSPNHMYLAENLTQNKFTPEENEILEIIQVPFKKAFRMVMDSKITHGASCVAILKIKEIWRKKNL